VEAIADQLAERLFDRVRLGGETGQCQLGRQDSRKSAHAPRDVERGGAGDGVRVARGQHQDRAEPERHARLLAVQSAHACAGGDSAEQRRLTILVSERARREPGAQPGRDLVPEDQSGQRLAAGALQPFGAGQRRRQRLHGALAGDIAMALAQLDGASGQPVEERGRARIRGRRARRVDGGAMAAGGGQPAPGRRNLGLDGSREDHADRVEHDELGVLAHRRGNRVPRRVGDESRQGFDRLAHRERRPYFSGGVTPAGSGTWATFKVIDTRL
jgi:hypothetical protein